MSGVTLVVAAEELATGSVVVDGDAYRHLFRARRMAAGERVRVIDGAGAAMWARIEGVDSRRARLSVEEAAPSNEPLCELEIWAGLPRPQRASWLVEKATELGVTAVRWLASARGGRDLRPAALERLHRVATAAVEQCHRARVPEISGPHGWAELERRRGDFDSAWVLDAAAVGVPGERSGRRWLLLVGPEGGFDAAERADLDAWAVRGVGLGPRVLRVETAAVAGAALLLSAGTPCDEKV